MSYVPNTRLSVLTHLTQDCFVRRLLCSLGHLEEEALGEVTTLALLLLYDPAFKYEATRHLLDNYHQLLCAVVHRPAAGLPRAPLATALDRLTVQLFNSEEVTAALVTRCDLLEGLLGCAAYMTGTALTGAQRGRDMSDDDESDGFMVSATWHEYMTWHAMAWHYHMTM